MRFAPGESNTLSSFIREKSSYTIFFCEMGKVYYKQKRKSE